MVKIYLCDLANDFNGIDNKSIPLGVGFVATYCKKIHKDNVDIKIYRTYKKFIDNVKKSPPDIAGFGSYDWNYNLTLNTIKKLKSIKPECIVAFGGANAEFHTKDNITFLSNNPNVDYIIYGDGEKPLSNLVANYISLHKEDNFIEKLKNEPIDGCRTLLNGKLITGLKSSDPIMEMDEVPSPYLEGFFDELLEDPTLMPIIQNIRGCPYLCRFCVSGTQYGKIRHFSFERIHSEISYLKKNAKNRFLRFSDDNFGIVEHDVEVAKYIRNLFEKEQYPAGLKVYSAKKQTDRVRLVGRILKPLMTYVVSLQTTTKAVLKETKRVSAKPPEAVESLDHARKYGLSSGTELIFGMPGESLESWRDVINFTLTFGFDSIAMNPLWILKGADLNRPESREENKYGTKFMLAENAVTSYDDFFSCERDEIAVESKYYTYDDWKIFLKYQIIILTLNYFGYGRELIYYAGLENIKPTDLIDYMINNKSKYPITNELVDTYVETYVSNMWNSEEELQEFIESNLKTFKEDKESLVRIGKARGLFGYIVKYILKDPDKKYLREVADAIIENGSSKKIENEVNYLLDLSITMMIDPFKEFIPDIEMSSDYDVFNWIKDGYSKPLSNYKFDKATNIKLKCRNNITVSETIRRDKEQNRTDCFNFFRYMNSGLMRRYIYSEELEVHESSPWEPYRREHRTDSISPSDSLFGAFENI